MASKQAGNGWSEPLPAPTVLDGFFVFEEGAEIEGVVCGTGETKYGPYYALKTVAPVRASQGGEYVELPKGSIVGVSDRVALGPLAAIIAAGPTAVKIVVKGKRGKAWDLEVRHREAF